jgi:hypothetical protein
MGRVGPRGLPVPPDLIYAEYARTGATAALLSRSFCAREHIDLASEVARSRERLTAWSDRTDADLVAAHLALGRRARLATCW